MKDTKRIAELNDMARTAMGICSQVVQTRGISALPSADQSRIREKVELFNDFNPDNDPYGERDFGSFEHNGVAVMWKRMSPMHPRWWVLIPPHGIDSHTH